jgi:hypothetical protein
MYTPGLFYDPSLIIIVETVFIKPPRWYVFAVASTEHA